MTFPKLKIALAAAALFGAAQSQAALTVYTSEAAFNAAVAALMPVLSGTDTFDDLVAGANLGAGPLVRAAGGIGYSATSGPATPTLFGAGSGMDNWLSNDVSTDSITLGSFAPGVFAAGANVFGSDAGGNFLRRGAITLAAVDGDSTASRTVRFAQATTFIGFISDSAITSLSVTATQGVRASVWPTVNNLTLASAVPEPETYLMMLAGIAAMGFVARRRRSAP